MKMQTALDVGKTIVSRREALGLTQAAFARQINVNQSSVSRWEKGMQSPASYLLPSIALALKCSVNDLLVTQRETQENSLNKALQLIPMVGSASAGALTERYPENGRSLYDCMGGLPSNVMAVQVRGDSMTCASPDAIADGDFVLIDPSCRDDLAALVGKVVCVRVEGEQHVIKQLVYDSSGVYFLRSWNPTYSPIPILSADAQVEGEVIMVIKRVERSKF